MIHQVVSIPVFLITIGSLLLAGEKVRADYTYTIDFETTNSGTTPADLDDDPIAAKSYAYSYQDLTITFEGNYDDDSDGNSGLAFEDYYVSSATASTYGYTANLEASEAKSGFETSDKPDQPATGYEQQAGNFFVRSKAPMNIIRIANSGSDPVSKASGEIWDIDLGWGTEAYNVYAYSISGSDYTLLGKQLSPGVGTQGDGVPWSWSFSGLNEGIDAIVVYQRGQQFYDDAPSGWTIGDDAVGGVGTGFWNNDVSGSYQNENASHADYFVNFDNLSFTVTPEPSTLLALGGLFSLAFLHRRRRSEID